MSLRGLAALLFLSAAAVGAQPVPGRDLLHYPLGLTGEAAALGTGPASGLWNPATGVLADGARGRVAASGLNAPTDVALAAQVLHGAVPLRHLGTVVLTMARAAVADLVRTETDPQSIGGDIPYQTYVLSAGAARRVHRRVAVGSALRWHIGHVDRDRGHRAALDAGVLVDGLTRRDMRLAMGTFLWTPRGSNAPSVAAAADVRVAGSDTTWQVRGGYSHQRTRGAATERYPYVDARFGQVAVRGGPVRVEAYGQTTWRSRLGIMLEHGGYTVAISREANASGLSPSYQLALTHVFR